MKSFSELKNVIGFTAYREYSAYNKERISKVGVTFRQAMENLAPVLDDPKRRDDDFGPVLVMHQNENGKEILRPIRPLEIYKRLGPGEHHFLGAALPEKSRWAF